MSERIFSPQEEAAFREQLSTVEGAQNLVNLTLKETHQLLALKTVTNEDLDNFEPLPYDLDQVLSRLRFIWHTLPEKVKSISVGFVFDEVDKKPKNNREFELRNLQFLLGQIGVQGKDGRIDSEITVQRPYIPDALRTMSHGSGSRELAHYVKEYLYLTRSSELNVLEVKPHGAPGGEAGIWAIWAVNYRIPLAQVKYIRLNTDEQPLTPWLQHDTQGGLQVRQVAE